MRRLELNKKQKSPQVFGEIFLMRCAFSALHICTLGGEYFCIS